MHTITAGYATRRFSSQQQLVAYLDVGQACWARLGGHCGQGCIQRAHILCVELLLVAKVNEVHLKAGLLRIDALNVATVPAASHIRIVTCVHAEEHAMLPMPTR
jgi:hypothetical protein